MNPDDIVTISLIQTKQDDARDYDKEKEVVLSTNNVIIHSKSMESVKTGAIVDFANRKIHIHSIIPSLTQEEILFSTYSECFIVLACVPNELEDDQVVLIKNVWRHSNYVGYAETFFFAGPNTDRIVQDIIVMDAPMSGQFICVYRDIFKAQTGFASTASRNISTGKWGCGAFGGDVTLKFLQQVIAKQLARKEVLYYSSFGNETEMNMMKILLSLIDEAKPTIGWMVKQMTDFHSGRFSFYLYMKDQLDLLVLMQNKIKQSDK